MQEKERWFKSTWFTIIMLIFVFPVGLFLMWKFKPHWKTWVKIVITILIAIIFLNSCMNNSDEHKKDTEPKTEQKSDKDIEKEKELKDKEEALKKREEELKKQEDEVKQDTQEENQQATDNNSNANDNQTNSSTSNRPHHNTHKQSAQQQPDAQAVPAAPQPVRSSYPSCQALRQDYPGGVSKGHPAYSANLDRDGDGTACEAKGN